ncbi:phosphotransferase enzyme family protein [Paenibacillus sp. Z6-24]
MDSNKTTPNLAHHDLLHILGSYALGNLHAVTEPVQGSTSQARIVHCTKGIFVVRRLQSRSQAEMEASISSLMAGRQVCPPMIHTAHGHPFTFYQNNYYNVQSYIEPLPVSPDPIDYEQLGVKTALFHTATRSLNVPVQPDRFSLICAVNRLDLNNNYDQLDESDQSIVRMLQFRIERCLTYENSSVQHTGYIHGDLGKWNLIFGSEGIFFIDFGEVRRGNAHFDIAALFTSMLDLSQDARVNQEHIRLFRQGYERYGCMDNAVLFEQIQLWTVRGIAALLIQHGLQKPVLRTAERLLYGLDDYSKLLDE